MSTKEREELTHELFSLMISAFTKFNSIDSLEPIKRFINAMNSSDDMKIPEDTILSICFSLDHSGENRDSDNPLMREITLWYIDIEEDKSYYVSCTKDKGRGTSKRTLSEDEDNYNLCVEEMYYMDDELGFQIEIREGLEVDDIPEPHMLPNIEDVNRYDGLLCTVSLTLSELFSFTPIKVDIKSIDELLLEISSEIALKMKTERSLPYRHRYSSDNREIDLLYTKWIDILEENMNLVEAFLLAQSIIDS